MILTYRESSITREISPSLSPELFLVREQRKGRAPEIYQLVPEKSRRFARPAHSAAPLRPLGEILSRAANVGLQRLGSSG
jgi:hypothetical protein